jgi:hypothetical protein
MPTLQSPSQLTPSDNWGQDNSAGRELGNAYVAAARSQSDPVMLANALRGLANSGRWTGIETGFAFAIATALAA